VEARRGRGCRGVACWEGSMGALAATVFGLGCEAAASSLLELAIEVGSFLLLLSPLADPASPPLLKWLLLLLL